MAEVDFELTFKRLGLTPTEAAGSCDATFTSAPQVAEGGPASSSSTLPQLQLATPQAAQDANPHAAELVAIDVLGEGGMGVVLLARQHSLGREVAVKVLKAGMANEAAASALIDEARTTGSLEHPGVGVVCFSYGVLTLSPGRYPVGVFSAFSALGLASSVFMFQRWRKELEDQERRRQ